MEAAALAAAAAGSSGSSGSAIGAAAASPPGPGSDSSALSFGWPLLLEDPAAQRVAWRPGQIGQWFRAVNESVVGSKRHKQQQHQKQQQQQQQQQLGVGEGGGGSSWRHPVGQAMRRLVENVDAAKQAAETAQLTATALLGPRGTAGASTSPLSSSLPSS